VDWVILEAVIVKNDGPVGIWIKIHLNPKTRAMIIKEDEPIEDDPILLLLSSLMIFPACDPT
jgi:hypothetical protein